MNNQKIMSAIERITRYATIGLLALFLGGLFY